MGAKASSLTKCRRGRRHLGSSGWPRTEGTELSHGQGQSEQFHPVGAPEDGVVRRHGVGFRYLTKECFHFAGRRQRDQQPAELVADVRPHVWNLARCEERIARLQIESLLADLDEVLPFQHVEQFILLQMEVTCGTTLCPVRVLDHESGAAAVLGGYLEVDGADPESLVLAEAVLSGRDVCTARALDRDETCPDVASGKAVTAIPRNVRRFISHIA